MAPVAKMQVIRLADVKRLTERPTSRPALVGLGSSDRSPLAPRGEDDESDADEDVDARCWMDC